MPRQQLDQVEGGVERSSGNTVKMTDLTSRVAQERERFASGGTQWSQSKAKYSGVPKTPSKMAG
jgi:hypothetical protein